MNERSKEEIDYLIRNLKLQKTLAVLCAKGVKVARPSEKIMWKAALNQIVNSSDWLAEKTLPKYFALLTKSTEALEAKIAADPKDAEKYDAKLKVQKEASANSGAILEEAASCVREIKELADRTVAIELESLDDAPEEEIELVLTQKQEEILKYSLVKINDL